MRELHDHERIVAHLARAKRIFQRLPEGQLRDLVQYILREDPGCWRTCDAGEVLFVPGEPAKEMFVVMDGAFEERADDDPRADVLWDIGPGDVVGEIELFAKHTRAPATEPERVSRVSCVEPGALLVIRQDVAERLVRTHGDFAVALLNAIATDAYRLIEEERRDARVMQTYFDGRLARLVPAPYRAESVEMNIVLAKSRSGGYESLVPPGVEAFLEPSGVFMLVFARFPKFFQPNRPDARPFEYSETAFFIPARMSEGPAKWRPLVFYAPAVYPDNFMALILGREIYGFRKRNAKTEVPLGDDGTPAGSPLLARLELDGAKVARLDYSAASPSKSALAALTEAMSLLGLPAANFLLGLIGDGPLATPIEVPVINLKQIPGPGHCDGKSAYEVNELCMTPFRIRRVHDVDVLNLHDLKLSGRIPFEGAELACPVGIRVRCDLDMETGCVVRRYEPDEEPLPDADAPQATLPRASAPGLVTRTARAVAGWFFDRIR